MTNLAVSSSTVRYRLSKKALSAYIRTGCRRRLRLDLLQSDADRRAEKAPIKDSARPGLTLLAKEGRTQERIKFAQLEQIFPADVIRGELRPFKEDEEQAFAYTPLSSCIGRLRPNNLVLEVQYEVTPTFIAKHGLDLVRDELALRGAVLSFAEVRPDILWVQPPDGELRRSIQEDGQIGIVHADDQRLGLRIIDIKAAGEASPGHFAELAFYGMTLAAWLKEHGHGDRFFVLADAGIWPGNHQGSTISRIEEEDRRARIFDIDAARYRFGLAADLETMPPEVVCDRVRRFLTVDLRQVLEPPSWISLPLFVGHRCQGCDYLGYRWSRSEGGDEQEKEERDARYCWPSAEMGHHLSRVNGLSEGAATKLVAERVATFPRSRPSRQAVRSSNFTRRFARRGRLARAGQHTPQQVSSCHCGPLGHLRDPASPCRYPRSGQC